MIGSRITIRADASGTIGAGHVMRCLTLANALRQSGADVLFVCRDHPGNLRALIASRGHAVTSLPTKRGSVENDDGPYASWRGADWWIDAEETSAAIAAHWRQPADWLIVDHYAIDSKWETALRPRARRVMVIDDLADRRHDCEVLLDQNLVADLENRYAGLVPEACIQLLGPEYALLGPEYAELHGTMRQRDGAVRRILVFFGGADPFGLTEKAVRAFLALDRPDIALDVVIGSMAASLPTIRALSDGRFNIAVHSDVPSLAPLMAKADLAIGAAGATSWERLCLKLPAIIVTIADNQRPIAAELSRRKLVDCVGDGHAVETSDLRDALRSRLNPNQNSRFLAPSIDGLGAVRVAAVLLLKADASLCVRLAEPRDEMMLLRWANDLQTRANSIHRDQISPETHRVWFAEHLADPARHWLFIVETAPGIPIGQVRFDKKDDCWVIDYSVCPTYRGRGLASRMLEHSLKALADEVPGAQVIGTVLPTNDKSHRVFRTLRFSASLDPDGTTHYRRAAQAASASKD